MWVKTPQEILADKFQHLGGYTTGLLARTCEIPLFSKTYARTKFACLLALWHAQVASCSSASEAQFFEDNEKIQIKKRGLYHFRSGT